MARIFRHAYTTYSKRLGKRVQRRTKNWYIEYKNAAGVVVRVPGYRDKLATQRKAAELEMNVIRQLRGERPEPQRTSDAPLASHLAAFQDSLINRNCSERHVEKTLAMTRVVLAGTGATFTDELTLDRVSAYLASLRRQGKAISTSNHYARAVKAFARWLWHTGRSSSHTLAGLAMSNEATDRRRIRRALTAGELARLLAATEREPARWRLSGTDRAMLYRIAAATGLRLGECLSLTVGSFHFDKTPATVVVEARASKRRRRDELPLPGWLVALVKPWLPDRARLFPVAKSYRGAEFMYLDLAAAGIEVKDARGHVADFGSLRVTFITALARAGVPLTTAQKLARHSTPMLTSNIYSALTMEELGDALDRVPPPG